MHMRRLPPGFAGLLTCVFLVSAGPDPSPTLPAPARHQVDFSREIKPLFEASCIQCHAKGKTKGGLSLETRQSFLKGGDSGPAALAGNSAESLVVKLVAGLDPDSQMPKKGKKWNAQQVGLLRAWIDQGAPWDASVNFARPEPANLKSRIVQLPMDVQAHPLDQILAAYFSAHAITPEPVVEDPVFARRAYLDLIGLLPTPRQLDEFLSDSRPDKRDQLVRKLLTDGRGYADHWLTFWNDLLRNDYRGTGFIDGGRRQISGWLYAALITNEPYDHFVRQLVNPDKSSEGFSRGIIWRGTVNASMLPPMQAAQNISQVFLGVNLKCASCHDSFVNDWTLADSYGLAAVYSDGPLELVQCDKPLGKTVSARFLYPQIGTIDPSLHRRQRLARLAEIMGSSSDGRLSRTIVNRLWGRLLGRGLVEPVDDMDRPAWNPDLLDWLADDLVAHHYDLKRTIEMILTSRAYQLPSSDVPSGGKDFVFRGPMPRRLTAEQFCDAVSSLSQNWARLPDTLAIDFTAGDQTGPIAQPNWIWTDQPVEEGQGRAQFARDRAKADEDIDDDDEEAPKKKKDAAANADRPEPPLRHKVVFRKSFELSKLPKDAYAAVGASQAFSVIVNGKLVRPRLSDGERRGRIALYDLSTRLVAGRNTIVLDVASHTNKSLNDVEEQQYPSSLNHLNQVSGVGFYLRANFNNRKSIEIVSDDTWRVFRSPDGKDWRNISYQDGEWLDAVQLPPGVAPVDEGSALPPITRKDFANEPIELATPMRSAVSTAAQPGGIRASMLAADPLMTALDRPNREQVMTVRSTAATTLQAVELTHGGALDDRIKRAAKKLFPEAKDDPDGLVTEMFRHALSREPTDQERQIAGDMIGDPATEEGVADFLWAVTMLPEFQLIR